MAGDLRRLLEPDDIRLLCEQIQMGWTDEERKQRRGDAQEASSYTVPQFLVHHQEVGRWVGGRCRSVRVWRCVDGR